MTEPSAFSDAFAKSLKEQLRKAEKERDEAIDALRPFAEEHTLGVVAPPRACARAAEIVAKREERR